MSFFLTRSAWVLIRSGQAGGLIAVRERYSASRGESFPARRNKKEGIRMAETKTEPDETALDNQTDGDRQLTTDSEAIDEGGTNDSDLGAGVAGDIGPKHE
jgi:hypothetical protein